MEGVHARTPLRLHGPQLRQAPRRNRHPVALQRRRARRDRAAVRRPHVPDPAGRLRGLRPRHRHRRIVQRSRLQSARSGRPRDPESGGVDCRRTSGREASIRSRSRPAAPSTTSTLARRPVAHPSLQAAAPEPWVGAVPGRRRAARDSRRATRFASPRHAGRSLCPARIGGPREGVVFVPFHYGYWDTGDGAGPDGQPRAANELTITLWDPVSKQPRFKTAAVKVERA